MSKHHGNLNVVENYEEPAEAVATQSPQAEQTKLELPDDFGNLGKSAEELAKQNASKRLVSGKTYLFHVAFEELYVADNAERPQSRGNYTWKLQLAPCDAKNKGKRPMISHYLALPFVNPAVPGHVAPDTFKMVGEYLSAEDPNFEAAPVWQKGSKPSTFLCSDGRAVNSLEEKAIKVKVQQQIQDRLKERMAQFKRTARSDFSGQGRYVYGAVALETQKEGPYAGRSQPKVLRFSSKPVDGFPLCQNPDEFGEEIENV